jgi:hypothetical protein
MSFDYTNAPTGSYATATIVEIAEHFFLGEYDALIDHSQLVWQDLNVAGVTKEGLFISYITTTTGRIVKVLAGLTSDGAIRFCMDDTPIDSRLHGRLFRLSTPWTPLMEHKARPQLVMLQMMVQLFFAQAGFGNGVKVEKSSWFRSLEIACRVMGLSMGVLPQAALAHRPASGRDDEGQG